MAMCGKVFNIRETTRRIRVWSLSQNYYYSKNVSISNYFFYFCEYIFYHPPFDVFALMLVLLINFFAKRIYHSSEMIVISYMHYFI